MHAISGPCQITQFEDIELHVEASKFIGFSQGGKVDYDNYLPDIDDDK